MDARLRSSRGLVIVAACLAVVVVAPACGDDAALLPSTGTETSDTESVDAGSTTGPMAPGDGSSSDGSESSSSEETGDSPTSSSSTTRGEPDSCARPGDCTFLDEACSVGECVEGRCASTPLPRGSEPEGDCEGTTCDGDGNCAQCLVDTDCIVATCEVASCEAGTCMVAEDVSQDCQPMEGLFMRGSNSMIRLNPQTGLVIPGAHPDLAARPMSGTFFDFAAMHPSDGRIYGGAATIYSLDPVAGHQALVARTGSVFLRARAFHPQADEVWAVRQGGEIVTFDLELGVLSSGVQTYVQAPTPSDVELISIAFGASGELYGLLPEADDVGLYSVDVDSGEATRVAGLPASTHSLAFASDEGVFYSLASDAEELVRIDVENQLLETVAIPGLAPSVGLLYDPSSAQLLGLGGAGPFASAVSVFGIDRGSQTSELPRYFGVGEISAVAADPDSDDFFVVNTDRTLFRVNAEAQTFERVGQIGAPSDYAIGAVAAAPGGELYVVEERLSFMEVGRVYRLDPEDASILATGEVPRGRYGNLAYDSGAGLLFSSALVSGLNGRQLVSIDAQTLSNVVLGTIPLEEVAYVESTGLLYGLDDAGLLRSVDASSSPPSTAVVGATEFPDLNHLTSVGDTIVALARGDALAQIDVESAHTVLEGLPRTQGSPRAAYDPLTRDVAFFLNDRRYRWDPWTNTTVYSLPTPPTIETLLALTVFGLDGFGYEFNIPPVTGGVGTLSRIDPETGDYTVIRDDFPRVSSVAFGSDGVLYRTGSDNTLIQSLYTVDLETGAETRVGALGISTPVGSMVWDRVGERLLGVVNFTTYVEIDPETAELAVIAAPVPAIGSPLASH